MAHGALTHGWQEEVGACSIPLASGPGYSLHSADLLSLKRFTAIRKTKGDGNCFYRALGYSYLESLLGKSREIFK
ncbi:hypothetical protein P7K49_018526 [Saguinus oedipus]|uniref:OTU domain-containing protein n=1 Tax=Saguinus oedipus TaxID=9490 RepID=A0ABQ9V6K7_SAGOE|nr:hypothetical protein P7K49_018526 [Saguinus oedipus]